MATPTLADVVAELHRMRDEITQLETARNAQAITITNQTTEIQQLRTQLAAQPTAAPAPAPNRPNPINVTVQNTDITKAFANPTRYLGERDDSARTFLDEMDLHLRHFPGLNTINLQVDVALFGDDNWVVPALHDATVLGQELEHTTGRKSRKSAKDTHQPERDLDRRRKRLVLFELLLLIVRFLLIPCQP